MKTEIKNMPTELINHKVKIVLSSLGLNERYNAFEYLSFVITYMIKNDTDSYSSFNEALNIIENKFNITKIAISYGLKRITDKCVKNSAINCNQFNLLNNGLVNRVRVMKLYSMQSF